MWCKQIIVRHYNGNISVPIESGCKSKTPQPMQDVLD